MFLEGLCQIIRGLVDFSWLRGGGKTARLRQLEKITRLDLCVVIRWFCSPWTPDRTLDRARCLRSFSL